MGDQRRQSRLLNPIEDQTPAKDNQLLLENNKLNDSVMSRSERLYREEVKNMLILMEHYKLQLTLVLPKVCFVVRKAQSKGKKKMEETQAKSKFYFARKRCLSYYSQRTISITA